MAYTEMHPREPHPVYDGLISDETECVQAAVFNWNRLSLNCRFEAIAVGKKVRTYFRPHVLAAASFSTLRRAL